MGKALAGQAGSAYTRNVHDFHLSEAEIDAIVAYLFQAPAKGGKTP